MRLGMPPKSLWAMFDSAQVQERDYAWLAMPSIRILKLHHP